MRESYPGKQASSSSSRKPSLKFLGQQFAGESASQLSVLHDHTFVICNTVLFCKNPGSLLVCVLSKNTYG